MDLGQGSKLTYVTYSHVHVHMHTHECAYAYAHECMCMDMHTCDPHDADFISLQVFGGIEQHGKQGAFFVMVEAHDTATLLPIIKEIHCAGDHHHDQLLEGIQLSMEHGYCHLNVNHSKNFKDPMTGAHTNTIEGSWLHAKRSLPVYGWKKDLMTGYLALFLWRRGVKRVDLTPFKNFLN